MKHPATYKMPKSERRQSGPTRVEPYPAIKPGDKPKNLNTKPATTKALAEKPAKSINTISKPKETKPKGAVKEKKPKAQAEPVKRRASLRGVKEPSAQENETKVEANSTKRRASIKSNDEPKAKKSKSEKSPTDKPSIPAPLSDMLSEKPASEKPAPAKPASKPSRKPSPKESADKPSSFLDVTLPTHLPSGDIPIHDTCSTIRQKINALLGKDNHKPENGVPGQFKKDGTPKPYTQAQFLRDIGGGSTTSYGTFMKAKKIMGGAESPIYPGAYAFFEKKRIWEGGKKLKAREKVEAEYVVFLCYGSYFFVCPWAF